MDEVARVDKATRMTPKCPRRRDNVEPKTKRRYGLVSNCPMGFRALQNMRQSEMQPAAESAMRMIAVRNGCIAGGSSNNKQ